MDFKETAKKMVKGAVGAAINPVGTGVKSAMSLANKFKNLKKGPKKVPYPIRKDPKTGRETHDLRKPLQDIIMQKRGMKKDGAGGPGMKNC